MIKYHKINSIFKRDMEVSRHPMIIGAYSQPEFEYLENNQWIGTEKIDGANIRVIYNVYKDPGMNPPATETVGYRELLFKGKTEEADVPINLLPALEKMFQMEKMKELFGDTTVTLYGEGYGNRIQSVGKHYLSDRSGFILFDIKIGNFWLKREDVEDLGNKLNIPVVPIVFRGTLKEGIEFVKQKNNSQISENRSLPMEGIVVTPAIQLFDRMGDRIITKIKWRDFQNT